MVNVVTFVGLRGPIALLSLLPPTLLSRKGEVVRDTVI